MMRQLLFVFLLIHSTLAKKAPVTTKKTWLTLKGDEPVVIARGGFSGLFPDSSEFAYKFALSTASPNVILFCDLQITKDNLAVCQSELRLDNSTNIPLVFPKGQRTYNVNGQDISGWFALDHTEEQLTTNVTLTENVMARSNAFDGVFTMWNPDYITALGPSKGSISLWLNVQYDMFYHQHKLSPAQYIEDSAQFWQPSHISSPEIGFLKSMNSKVDKAKTKLIFRFLNADAVEPTTKEKYGSLLKKLSTIKSFASGILVPKNYIWPVNKDLYLQPATTLVVDAHKLGLEVYASGFANDGFYSYNYSFDPITEYLKFIDNSEFSVDGLLTDFPSTASESIACFAQTQNTTRNSKALIISHSGASGDYPGSTDLAYQKAIDDGADIIDCSVQMSKDGVAFCLETADLTGKTTAATTFVDRSATITEIQPNSGIFSFDLTWSEIQSLKPQISNPFSGSSLIRNPAYKNAGKFTTLSEFLELAKTKATTGILINIENAPYLASKKGLSITDVVATALSNATFDKQSTQKVLIQSDDSSVLSKFKEVPTYQRVLSIKHTISDAPKKIVEEVKKYADAVAILRYSIVKQDSAYFATAFTNVVEEMHAANISVYASTFSNEFVSLIFDYFSDPYVELATMNGEIQLDGFITDHPASANAYMRSPCSDLRVNQKYLLPIKPGALLDLVQTEVQPPTLAPAPSLEAADVVDPPLPAVANFAASNSTPAAPAPKHSSSTKSVANAGLSIVLIMLIGLLSLRF